MVNEEYKEFFEKMFEGFTKAVFAGHYPPSMYMVVKDKQAEVIPSPLKGMTNQEYAETVATYANVTCAQFIAHITFASSDEGEESLLLTIGDPRGQLHAIYGEMKRASDGSPYVDGMQWATEFEMAGEFAHILPFTD